MADPYIKVEYAIREIEFQKQEMVKYMREWGINENDIDMAVDAFDNAIHGIDSHMPHIMIEEAK